MTTSNTDHDTATMIAQQRRTEGKAPSDIACELASLAYSPNDVLTAIASLGLTQVDISNALQTAFPAIPRQGRIELKNITFGPSNGGHADNYFHTDIGLTGYRRDTIDHWDVDWVDHVDAPAKE